MHHHDEKEGTTPKCVMVIYYLGIDTTIEASFNIVFKIGQRKAVVRRQLTDLEGIKIELPTRICNLCWCDMKILLKQVLQFRYPVGFKLVKFFG